MHNPWVIGTTQFELPRNCVHVDDHSIQNSRVLNESKLKMQIMFHNRTSYEVHSQPIVGLITTFFESIASKHEVDIPSTPFCNCSRKASISDAAISTIIINEKCPPRSRDCDAPTFPPLAVTILVTSATIPGRSTPTVLITTLFLGWDVNFREGDGVKNSMPHICVILCDAAECRRSSSA